MDDESRRLAELVDGQRSIEQLAILAGVALYEAQLRVADLRDRAILALA